MKGKLIDNFEYKGKSINVYELKEKVYFVYVEEGEEIILNLEEIVSFINSSFTHKTINNNVLDVIEKSIKINNFLFNLKDLKLKLKKYI